MIIDFLAYFYISSLELFCKGESCLSPHIYSFHVIMSLWAHGSSVNYLPLLIILQFKLFQPWILGIQFDSCDLLAYPHPFLNILLLLGITNRLLAQLQVHVHPPPHPGPKVFYFGLFSVPLPQLQGLLPVTPQDLYSSPSRLSFLFHRRNKKGAGS